MILRILRKQFLPIFSLLIIGICLSLVLFFMLRNREGSDIRAELHLDAQRMTNELQRKIDTNLEALQSCYSFFQSSQEVTFQEFSEFVKPILSRHTIIQAIGWIPKVTRANRKDFESSARQLVFSSYGITEQDSEDNLVSAKKREVYYPVLFIEPVKGNEQAFGFDLSSNAIRYDAMVTAMDSGMTTVSSKLKIVQEKANQKSILVFFPLYNKNVPLDTIEQRRANLLGFLSAIYRLPELLGGEDKYLGQKRINVFYYDHPDMQRNNLVYEKLSMCGNCSESDHRNNISCSFMFPLLVANRSWSVLYEVNKCYFAARMSSYPWIILICSLLITGLIGKYLILTNLRANEIHELAGILIDKNQELENVNQELDTFVYTASHDLSSPLKTISAFANILKEDYSKTLSDEGNDILDRIIKGTKQMDRLIKDLLELSRTSRIKNPYSFVDINELIDKTKERVCINDDKLNVRFKVMKKIPQVYCDPVKISEVFFNLISNAVKFSSKNENKTPLVEIGYTEKDGVYEFFVKDNGIGIEEQYQGKIFDLFVRLHSEAEYEGTGLGLAIVKKVINEHSGSLWVESEEDKGATFFFTLPKK